MIFQWTYISACRTAGRASGRAHCLEAAPALTGYSPGSPSVLRLRRIIKVHHADHGCYAYNMISSSQLHAAGRLGACSVIGSSGLPDLHLCTPSSPHNAEFEKHFDLLSWPTQSVMTSPPCTHVRASSVLRILPQGSRQ
eukprot:149981_1